MTTPPQHIVLLHGVNNIPEIWDSCATRLSNEYRIISPKLPVASSLEMIADELLAELPDRFIGVGHSFGGMVLAAMIARASERVGGAAFIATRITEDPKAVRERKLSADHYRELSAEQFAERIGTGVFHDDYRSNPELSQQRIAHVRAYGPDAFASHQIAMARRGDHVPIVADHEAPKLWIVPSDDTVIPQEDQTSMASAIHAETVEVERTGHMIVAERPGAVAEILTEWATREFG